MGILIKKQGLHPGRPRPDGEKSGFFHEGGNRPGATTAVPCVSTPDSKDYSIQNFIQSDYENRRPGGLQIVSI